MTQRTGILQHPLRFTPGLTSKLGDRLVELLLGLFASIEMPRGIKPPQRLGDLPPRFVGLHRLIKEALRLAPGATGTAC